MNKKIYTILLSILLCISTISFANAKVENDKASQPLFKLTVGVNPDYAPFESDINSFNEIIGFDMDLIHEICTIIHCSVEIKKIEFADLLPAVANGDVDIAISAISITKKRKELVDFSAPYFYSHLAALINKNLENKVGSISDLNSEEYTLCAIEGTRGEEYTKENLSKSNLVLSPQVSDILNKLKNDECVAIIYDKPFFEFYLYLSHNHNYYFIPDNTQDEEYGIAVSKKSPELLKKINGALAQIQDRGYYDQIYMTWFGKPSTFTELSNQVKQGKDPLAKSKNKDESDRYNQIVPIWKLIFVSLIFVIIVLFYIRRKNLSSKVVNNLTNKSDKKEQ